MKNILFIINPIAGSGKAQRLIPRIEQVMEDKNIDYKIILTSRPKDATKLAEDNAKNYTIIVAVGGDGTVNEIAKGLINAGQGTLGIIPCGTGNDMSKSLEISKDIDRALATIIKGNKKKIDIGMINDHYFLNIASIGFDAEVVKAVEGIKKKIKGKMAYVLGVFKVLTSYKKRDIRIELDDKTIEIKSVLLAVGNGSYYGGGMKILPMALVDDGFLHICSIKDVSNLKMLFLFPSIFSGGHIKIAKYIDTYRSKKVVIKNPGLILLN